MLRLALHIGVRRRSVVLALVMPRIGGAIDQERLPRVLLTQQVAIGLVLGTSAYSLPVLRESRPPDSGGLK